MYKILSNTALFLLLPFLLIGHDFIYEVERLKGLPPDEFLDRYPYLDYIEACSYDNIRELEYQKYYLDQMGMDGEAFIYRLYEEYLAHAEMDFNDVDCIKKLLFTGELMARSIRYLHPDSAFVYVAAGDLIFASITDSLETLLQEEKVDKKDFGVKYIVRRLAENKFLVNIPTSNWEKFRMHFWNGNFSYLWEKATGTYIKEFKLFLSVTIPLAVLISWLIYLFFRRRQKNKLKVVKTQQDMAAAMLLLCFSLMGWAVPHTKAPSASGELSEKECNTSFSGLASIHELVEKNAITSYRPYGHSIWLNMDSGPVKVNYLPGQSHFTQVYEQFKEWSPDKNILLISSGAYAIRGYKAPLGFTLDAGNTINKNWKEEMDALVMIDDNKLVVYNKEQRFTTSTSHSFYLSNILDRSILENWGVQNGLTIFQTHLLAYEGQLKISTSGRNKVAKRKFLALIEQSGQHYAVLYYTKGNYLYDAAKEVYDLLKAKPGCHIEAMINLDTGVQDVLELHSSIRSCKGTEIKGLVSGKYAMNLLTFYLD